jgi:hypothetical protein
MTGTFSSTTADPRPSARKPSGASPFYWFVRAARLQFLCGCCLRAVNELCIRSGCRFAAREVLHTFGTVKVGAGSWHLVRHLVNQGTFERPIRASQADVPVLRAASRRPDVEPSPRLGTERADGVVERSFVHLVLLRRQGYPMLVTPTKVGRDLFDGALTTRHVMLDFRTWQVDGTTSRRLAHLDQSPAMAR